MADNDHNILERIRQLEAFYDTCNSNSYSSSFERSKPTWCDDRFHSMDRSLFLPGVRTITDSEANPMRRLLWFILIVAGLVCTTFLVCDRYQYYRSAPTFTTIREIHHANISFPGIIIPVPMMPKTELITRAVTDSTRQMKFHRPKNINYAPITEKPRQYYFINTGNDTAHATNENDYFQFSIRNPTEIVSIQLYSKNWFRNPPVKQGVSWVTTPYNRDIVLWVTPRKMTYVKNCRLSSPKEPYDYDECLYKCFKEQLCHSAPLQRALNREIYLEPAVDKNQGIPNPNCSNLNPASCPHCMPECTEMQYTIEVKVENERPKLNTPLADTMWMSTIKLRYRTLRLEVVEEHFQYDSLTSFLVELGGALNLIIGASLIITLQLLDYGLTTLLSCCSCRKRRSHNGTDGSHGHSLLPNRSNGDTKM